MTPRESTLSPATHLISDHDRPRSDLAATQKRPLIGPVSPFQIPRPIPVFLLDELFRISQLALGQLARLKLDAKSFRDALFEGCLRIFKRHRRLSQLTLDVIDRDRLLPERSLQTLAQPLIRIVQQCEQFIHIHIEQDRSMLQDNAFLPELRAAGYLAPFDDKLVEPWVKG